MHIIIIFTAVVILFTGIFYSKQANVSRNDQNDSKEVLSVAGVDDSSPTEVVKPTSTPHPTILLTPTPKNSQVREIAILSYQYPNSQITSSSSDSLSLKSSDPVDSITEWYKSKIKNEGMNIKTFVTTKANDRVENVLVGSMSGTQIRVEIKKEPSDNNVTISVTKASS